MLSINLFASAPDCLSGLFDELRPNAPWDGLSKVSIHWGLFYS